MTLSYVAYPLEKGFIHNWLVAGPQSLSPGRPLAALAEEEKRQIVASFADERSGITRQPVECGPLQEGKFKIGTYEGEWSYYRCLEDHWIDHSQAVAEGAYLRSWAYTQLVSSESRQATFTLVTAGVADVWVNDERVLQWAPLSDAPVETSFTVDLREGTNDVLIRFGGIAAPDGLLVVALRVDGEGIQVQIPTLIPALDRRNDLERVFNQVYLDRDVYAAGQEVYLHWPDWIEKEVYQDVRLQTTTGRIYGQAEAVGEPGQALFLGDSVSLLEGPYHAFLMPRAWEMYDRHIRVTKKLPAWVMGRNRFSDGPYGSAEERRQEALIDAARREDDLFAEIAKMALGRWKQIDRQVIFRSLESVKRQELASERQLLGLLGAVGRFGSQPDFPRWIKKEIKAGVVEYAFPVEVPPVDSSLRPAESAGFLRAVCQILAGQLYPEATFQPLGITGQMLRKRGEASALAWMKEHGRWGFSGWDSPEIYADTLTALGFLVDLARTEAVWELGSVLMDKIFFSLALNSFRGVFGSTRGWATTWSLKSGYLEATSGITRLMWGMGVFNRHIAGTVSLACLRKYELPPIFADIAASLPGEVWSREQQGCADRTVNKVTYRTPDAMLCSAQDYRPGERGTREHIWQATLGPQAPVFVNHPGCAQENDIHTPNFWLGNGALPRVAQWKDALIALYKLPADARMPFTHAYFPTRSFDEYALQGNAAFARQGEGYLALIAVNGMQIADSGRAAYRELRSEGLENVWLCQIGRAALDGDFASFQQKVLAAPLHVDGQQVRWETIRGEVLTFGWEAPLTVNGEEQPLHGFLHFDNPFTQVPLPCEKMEVRTEDYLLRLDFGDEVE